MASQAPAARVAQAMLQRAPADEPTLQSVADDAATLELPALARRLPHLSMLANSATLLGLLGTVFGLMQAFASVQAADPAQRAAFLAAGISAALNTTAFGLLVAVPTLLAHGWLVSRVEGLAEQTDEMAIRLGRALSTPAAALRSAQVTPLHAARPAAATAARPALGGPAGGN
jgi:biopolymer transport protein ExbB/TolQ